MSEKQDLPDDIQTISHKFKSATTIEPVFNAQDQRKTSARSNSSTSPYFHSDGKTNYDTDDYASIRNVPELNLPEKILFVIDTVSEANCTPFKLGTGAKYQPLFMIKRVVETFVIAKSTIQRAHEFALMTLDLQNAHWICDFTNNTKTIMNYLDTVSEEIIEEENSTYDLGQAFEKIKAHLPLSSKDQAGIPPMFASRVILIYSRSNCVPKFHTGHEHLERLAKHPYFFLDVLFVHEPPSSENKCDDVYAEIAALDTTNFSYILEVGRNAAKLHDNMAKLLAHPLQRPPQKDARYTIFLSQEVHTNV